MFDKFFVMLPNEKRVVLSGPDNEIMQLTITGVTEDKLTHEACYVLSLTETDDTKEHPRWVKCNTNQEVEIQLRDKQSLIIQTNDKEIDFHINGHIYQVN